MNPDTVVPFTERQAEEAENAVAHLLLYTLHTQPLASYIRRVDGGWVEGMAVRGTHPSSMPTGFGTVHTAVDFYRWKFIEQDAHAQFGPPPSWRDLIEPRDWWPS